MIRRGALILVVAIAGCTAPVVMRWDRASTTEQEFARDRYACLQESKQQYVGAPPGLHAPGAVVTQTVVSGPMFDACMAARGYRKNVSSGQFAAPPGSAVPMRP